MMKKYEMMMACLKQLIFDDFIIIYHDSIQSLLEQEGFLFYIRQARGDVKEEIEFCRDNSNLEFRKFKKHISSCFYECGAYNHYPELRYIKDQVKSKGVSLRGKPYTAASASISVYYMIRFYQIYELDIE